MSSTSIRIFLSKNIHSNQYSITKEVFKYFRLNTLIIQITHKTVRVTTLVTCDYLFYNYFVCFGVRRMATSVQGVNPLFTLSAFNMFFYLLTPAIVLWYIYFRMSRKNLYELADKIQGSDGLPLLGNALDFMQDPHSEYNGRTRNVSCDDNDCLRFAASRANILPNLCT